MGRGLEMRQAAYQKLVLFLPKEFPYQRIKGTLGLVVANMYWIKECPPKIHVLPRTSECGIIGK